MSDRALVLGWAVDGSSSSLAARLLAWLVERGVVEALPTDSGLTALAHRPGPRALEAVVPQKASVYDFRTLVINGVELTHTTQTQLLHGDEMPEFACPACGAAMDTDAVMERMMNPENPFLVPTPTRLSCARCNKSLALNELAVSNGAFVNVVLRFWNWWPLKPEFIAELGQIGGRESLAVFHERV
jgi:hypothetical protein